MDCVFEYGIRYVCGLDVPSIVDIETATFPFPWNEADFEAARKEVGVHIIVAISETRLIGYAVFELGRDTVEVIKLAVAPQFRRHGVGTALLDRIRAKLWETTELIVRVRESNLPGQLFLRDMGLTACVEREFFQNRRACEYGDDMPWCSEDAYRFAQRDMSPDSGLQSHHEPIE